MEHIALPIVITGHIDHGKSTLIGRLLYDTGVLKEDKYVEITKTSRMLGKQTEFAFVLDALKEEREKGITIDTTQIYFQTQKRKYVIIDAPGHKEFLRNMITGASYAEAAVLIIDANEGIKEQTKRHAYLLSIVGINEICVLINKMDLVDFSKQVFDKIVNEINNFFSTLSIKPKFFIPISALLGINVAKKDSKVSWYHGPSFFEALDEFTFKPLEKRPFRFPIQDVYKIDNEMVYVGKVESGEIESGVDAFVYPGGKNCKIVDIKKFLKNHIKNASYGESIGLIIKGGKPIKRGNVLTTTQDIQVKKQFDANLFWFYGKYDKNDLFTIKCTTQESICSIEIIEKFDPATMEKKEKSDTLDIGEVAKVKIKTKKPLVIDLFSYIPEMGRFIIEKSGVPVGGGIIV